MYHTYAIVIIIHQKTKNIDGLLNQCEHGFEITIIALMGIQQINMAAVRTTRQHYAYACCQEDLIEVRL